MQYIKADLLNDVVDTYDQTKTTIQGRVYEKTIDGEQVLGPPLNHFVDVVANSGVIPATSGTVITPHGRMFTVSQEAGGLITIVLHTMDFDTGVTTYIGNLIFRIPDTPAATYVYRALKVLDNAGNTGWRLTLTVTSSVLTNAGTWLINNIDLADFVPVGPATLEFATGDNQKAVYLLQDPANIGAGQLQTASAGAVLYRPTSSLYVHNGVAATHQYYLYDLSINPTWDGHNVTGDAGTDIISDAGHTYANGDPVRFSAITGGAGLSVQNTAAYFVVNSVPGVSYQLSATNGGAAINFTTNISAAILGRAWGTTGSNFVHKTGNLPALTGTLLLTDSEDLAIPTGTTNDGENCAFFCTTTQMYLGRLSDLTSGTTSWPSLIAANMLGAPNEIVTPAATQAAWSSQLNRAVVGVGQLFICKPFENNVISFVFGGTNNTYLEGISTNVVALQPAAAISSMDLETGWICITNPTTGQRGVMLSDLQSNATFDHSYIVTKVMDTPDAVYDFITTTDKLFEYTGALSVYYRTSGFGSISGGWLSIPFAEDLENIITPGAQIQFKILFDTAGLDTSIPAQLQEFFLGYTSLFEISSQWEFSYDASSSGSPTRFAFRLKKEYDSAVPELNFRAYDLSSSLVINFSSVADAARFEYSTDDGDSWNALGTIPNTVGTLVRVTPTSPPGVKVRPSLVEA